MKVEYDGADRYTLRGALTYPDGFLPELGTILGPGGYGEYVCVVAHQDGKALVAVATATDMAAGARPGGSPRSLVEQKMYAPR